MSDLSLDSRAVGLPARPRHVEAAVNTISGVDELRCTSTEGALGSGEISFVTKPFGASRERCRQRHWLPRL